MIQNPIFIIGTERSGSNLLRLLLNAHPSIAIPHPPHIMRDLSPFSQLYGDLLDDGKFRGLICDVVRIVNSHFAPWPMAIDEEKLFSDASSRSLYGIYAALYEQYLLHAGKKRWGCKSTFMYIHIEEILAHHSSPRFLHLVRDPRDVAASAGQSIFSRFHPYKEAELWAEQQSAIEVWRGLEEEGKLLRVRYEDLTADAEAVMKEIMEFLGEEFLPQQLEYYRSGEASRLSGLSQSWKNCGEPVSVSSVGRYKTELSEREIRFVESVAAALMSKYGYGLHTKAPLQSPSVLELFLIECSERWRKLRAELRALFTDRNFFLRWRKWFLIRLLIWKQYLISLRQENGPRTGKHENI